MLADMQRARLLAGQFGKCGWDVEILAPDATFQPDYSIEPDAERFFPDVTVHSVGPWMPSLFRLLRAGTIGWRALVPVGCKGDELLASGRFDLVYFSTTVHLLTCWGPRWRRKHGVPYIADVHDPVYKTGTRYVTSQRRAKAWIADRISRSIERRALGEADGLVTVSEGYAEDLASRYPDAAWQRPGCILVQPFPADMPGLEAASADRFESQTKRVVYVGAGGTIMEKGWRALLEAWKAVGAKGLSIEIHGTAGPWRPGQTGHLQAVAEASGLSNMDERPVRIPYARSLELVKGADGLLVLGVDDPNYRPSKLHTYLATGLPVLVVVHERSGLGKWLESAGPGIHIVRFGASSHAESNKESLERFVMEVAENCRWKIEDRKSLLPATAAVDHARFFEGIAAARGKLLRCGDE
jgi:glycosyltransferase involved in cell wall biosynthesis